MSTIMRRSPDKCAILLALILACGYASAGHLVKRESKGGLVGLLDQVKSFAADIPIVGNLLSDAVQKLEDLWNKLQDLTNGAVGRALGGAFPCTVSLDDVLACEGVSSDSDISGLVESMMDSIPSLILPGFLKSLIVYAIDMFVEPAIDVLFGGVPTEDAKA